MRLTLATLAATVVCFTGMTAVSQATTVTLKAGLYAKMETSKGDMVFELYEKEAPVTVKNFTDLAEGKKKWRDPQTKKWQESKPLYDGTIFHRLIPKFMVQGGDPSGTGGGNVGFTIPLEKSPKLNHDRPGRLSMARKPQPDTAGSQFFITFAPAAFLDRPPGYASFGQLIHGTSTLRSIEKAPRDPTSREQARPTQKLVLKKVTILRVSKGQTLKVALLEPGSATSAASAGGAAATAGTMPGATPVKPRQMTADEMRRNPQLRGLPIMGSMVDPPSGKGRRTETTYRNR